MSDPANWVGNVAPQPEDNLVFPTNYSSLTTINDDLGANFRLRSITISGSNFNIAQSGSSSIQLMESFTADNPAGTSNTFGVPMLIVPATTLTTLGETIFNANPGASLNLSGAIDTARYSVDDADHRRAGATNISGPISDAGGLVKNGAGTLTLSGNNSYEGITDINQGAINIQSNTALGSTASGTLVNAGAALQVQGSSLSIGEPLAINGNGVGFNSAGNNTTNQPITGLGAVRNISGSNTISGGIQLPNATNTTTMIGVDSGTLSLSGEVTGLGVGGFVKMGAGTLQLNGSVSNLILGTTTVQQGTLMLAMTNTSARLSKGA